MGPANTACPLLNASNRFDYRDEHYDTANYPYGGRNWAGNTEGHVLPNVELIRAYGVGFVDWLAILDCLRKCQANSGIGKVGPILIRVYQA
jgi:hypothetical protein